LEEGGKGKRRKGVDWRGNRWEVEEEKADCNQE
jgi:hypothetical protein